MRINMNVLSGINVRRVGISVCLLIMGGLPFRSTIGGVKLISLFVGVDSKGELGVSPAERTDVVDSLNLIRIMPAEGREWVELAGCSSFQ